MLLTKLEIKGFKSFGDKVVINFDEGVTGIVGPNGCGKSNVVDAIRWVLGEQKTRMLRSDKMENVIFNGTKTRKPTQLAEVSLTFSNTKNLLPTEYSTLTVTRRYFRTGESEYEMNGISCRLKDITNLFLDTGISSNSYSIIELKMVDDLLNDKDNSRRQLFEEAAGISKFKKRKKETLKKLEDTDADLARVDDLLFEIVKNMKSLEKQAKQTEKYYELKESYKIESIKLAKTQSKELRELRQAIENQIENEELKRSEVVAGIAGMEATLEQIKTDLIAKEKLLASRQKNLNAHVNTIRQLESDKKIKNERTKYLSERSNSLAELIERDKESRERAEFALKGLQQEKQSCSKLLAEIELELEQFRASLEEQRSLTNGIQTDFNNANANFKKVQEEAYQYAKSLEIKEIQLSSLRLELEKTSIGNQEKTDQLGSFDEKIAGLELEKKRENDLFEFYAKEEVQLEQKKEETEQLLDVNKESLVKLKRTLDAKENEYRLTKSLVENLEGFPEAIKFLKKNARWAKETPLLSDIITCDEKYRVVIENYLEHYMNYFIVEIEAQAFEAIHLLAESNRGKANFFILNKFSKKELIDDHAKHSGIRALDIIEYDAKYTDLVHFILGNVFIINEMHLTEPESDHIVYLSADGGLNRRKISISGGSVGLFEGKKIGRIKNLDKLSKEIKDLSKQIEKLEDICHHQQERLIKLKNDSRKKEIELSKQKLSTIEQELTALKSRKDQLEEFINSETTRREDILDKVAILTEETANLRPLAENSRKILAEKDAEISSLNDELKRHNELLNVKSSGFNQQNILFHQQQNKFDSINREIEFKEQTIQASIERIEKSQQELKQTDSEIRKLLEQSDSQEEGLLSLYEEKQSLEEGVNEAEREYYQIRAEIESKEKQIRDSQRSKELCENLLFDLRNHLNEHKLQLQSLTDRLAVEFNVDPDTLLNSEVDTEHINSDLLRQNIQRIKEQMERLGPINPLAMEAYKEIQERHDFIVEQKDDLMAARDSLMQTISEIDTVAKENFLEAFASIKANFVKVFRSLFTDEDDCDLILTDPENPLESAIDIIAKPKGKRPLSINQLSGGEKTLTATSLLFAIYLLKPAPFCIFDEVDAPLDDANIDKFNTIIRKFSQESQFIIVTHNKRTMASTDIIYGITMIEQGVSRVVPVDLRTAV
jgi:chromosome segregation protein